ncbi:uncharacterized protein B0H18DRAFT_855057, partial [Fomitopsis serialis]|uniref:uncharacterized protein n=1 Tax=Fomitopsis serialis TaxID=139415 RepID=UPI0020081781
LSATLASEALESLFFGIFLVLAFTSVYFHVARTDSGTEYKVRRCLALWRPIFVGSIFITVTVTAHWVTIVVRLFDAFVNFESGTAPSQYYSNLATSTEAIKTSFLIVTLIECDIMLIYRLWIVWNYSYMVIFIPTCAVLGLLTGPGAIYQQTCLKAAGADTVFLSVLSRWITSSYAFTFVTNVYSTCGIVYRVWSAVVASPGLGAQTSWSVPLGTLLYRSYTIFFFVSYEARSNIQYFCIDTLCPIAGIVFMLINVRVGLGW